MLTPAEVVAAVMSPYAAEDLGPLVTVDAGDGRAPSPWDADAFVAAMSAVPAITVAVCDAAPRDHVPFLDAFDVVVAPGNGLGEPEALVAALTDVVDAHAGASLVLVQVLRASARVSVAAGLAIESLAYGLLQAGPDHAAWQASRAPGSARPSPGEREPVRVEHHRERLVITLNRPEVHNALDASMRDALVEALRAGVAQPGTPMVLRGAGASFCSGGDLDEFGTTPDVLAAHRVRAVRSPAWWAWRAGPRLEAEVHGACVGAGVELSAWAREVRAEDDAWFVLPEVGMGLIPGAGGTVSLPRRIGRHRTALLALTGARLDVTAARAWGLVGRHPTR